MRYGEDYREVVQLSGGQEVLLRLGTAQDRKLLLDGFERTSLESRRARFMSTKNRLTEEEIRYLTTTDNWNHLAIAAVRQRPIGGEQGVGVGRFVRLIEDSDVAEPAITIVDEFQGRGLGSILFERLTQAAWERGIRWFRAELLAQNVAMRSIMHDLSPQAKFQQAGDGVLEVMLPIPSPVLEGDESGWKNGPLHRLLASVAATDAMLRLRSIGQAVAHIGQQ